MTDVLVLNPRQQSKADRPAVVRKSQLNGPCTPMPVSTHNPHSDRIHSFLGSSIVTVSCHVPDAIVSRTSLFLPNYLPSCPELVPKADEKRPSRTSPGLPVAILRVN